MRHLDRWIGVPLCFLATFVMRLSGLFSPQRMAAAPGDRVLYVALAEMGSIVLAAPAIRQSMRRHGAAPVFVTLEPTREVFDFLGGEFAREVQVLRTGSLAALCADLWRFARWTRRNGIAVAIDLDPGARFSALVALLSGAPLRAGFAGPATPYRGALYTHAVPCATARHMSANFDELAQAPFGQGDGDGTVVGLPVAMHATTVNDERLRRFLAPDERQQRRIVLIHANISDPVPQRRWPRRHYAALCRRLLDESPDLLILLIGSAAEAPPAAALCAEVDDPRCASVAGRFAIAELPALFARATLLLSSDSGPAHFAAHAGLPVVALFGPETPLRYRPLGDTVALHAGLSCSPCLSASNQRQSRCREPRCMPAIGVDAVLGELRRHLQPASRRQSATA